MAIYLARKLSLALAENSAYKPALTNRDLPQLSDSTLTGTTTDRRTIAVSTNVQINLGGITTARAILVETDAEVRLRIDAQANDFVPIKPISAGQQAVGYLETSATQVWLENPSATVIANVTVTIAGT